MVRASEASGALETPGMYPAGPRPACLADGLTVWLTGLPCAGKTTIATGLAARLRADGYPVEVLDGDVLRRSLCDDLGFSAVDRSENVMRVGFVAHLLSRNGVVAVCALISPYRETRDAVRAMHQGRFFEVYVATPQRVCADRDVKGLYALQRAGTIVNLTGVDDPYEPPMHPEVVLPTHLQTVAESVETVWAALPR
jgi:adenylylsulfate kinase